MNGFLFFCLLLALSAEVLYHGYQLSTNGDDSWDHRAVRVVLLTVCAVLFGVLITYQLLTSTPLEPAHVPQPCGTKLTANPPAA